VLRIIWKDMMAWRIVGRNKRLLPINRRSLAQRTRPAWVWAVHRPLLVGPGPGEASSWDRRCPWDLKRRSVGLLDILLRWQMVPRMRIGIFFFPFLDTLLHPLKVKRLVSTEIWGLQILLSHISLARAAVPRTKSLWTSTPWFLLFLGLFHRVQDGWLQRSYLVLVGEPIM
jgi:hypothetical protein